MNTQFKVDYDFNQNWSKVTRIKIQKLVWPGSQSTAPEWETIKSEPYTGEEQEQKFKNEVEILNSHPVS